MDYRDISLSPPYKRPFGTNHTTFPLIWKNKSFAIKTIEKAKVGQIETLRREIEILRCVDHPRIIKLYDVYEDDRFIHLVTELCTGGELFDRIIQKAKSEEGHYSEKDAKVGLSLSDPLSSYSVSGGGPFFHVYLPILHLLLYHRSLLFSLFVVFVCFFTYISRRSVKTSRL